MNCIWSDEITYVNDLPYYRCVACDVLMAVKYPREITRRTCDMTEPESGPGTELSKAFGKLGIESCTNCSELAKLMNVRGAEWCRENVDQLVDHIEANRKMHDSLVARLSSLAPTAIRRSWLRRAVLQACNV